MGGWRGGRGRDLKGEVGWGGVSGTEREVGKGHVQGPEPESPSTVCRERICGLFAKTPSLELRLM